MFPGGLSRKVRRWEKVKMVKVVPRSVGDFQVLCYLVYEEESGDGVLIDPAGDVRELLRMVKDHGVTLRYVVITHGHPDHTAGNALIKERTGAPVVMHSLDDDFSQQREVLDWGRSMGMSPPPPADIRVEDGDELLLGGTPLKFIHTPGHTPGACCVLVEGNLFTGDTLFVGAVGRTDLPGASFDRLLESIRDKILPLPGDTVIWPGHDYGDRPRTTLAHEMETNPYITDFLLDE